MGGSNVDASAIKTTQVSVLFGFELDGLLEVLESRESFEELCLELLALSGITTYDFSDLRITRTVKKSIYESLCIGSGWETSSLLIG